MTTRKAGPKGSASTNTAADFADLMLSKHGVHLGELWRFLVASPEVPVADRQFGTAELARAEELYAAGQHEYAVQVVFSVARYKADSPRMRQAIAASRANSANRKGKGVDKDAVRAKHAALVRAGNFQPTSDTASHFGLSVRRVRQILAERSEGTP